MKEKEIGKFYSNAIIFSLILVVILIIGDYASTLDSWKYIIARFTNSLDYMFGNVGTDEINPCLEAAMANDGTTRLILGDSVCHQMFGGLSELNSDFTIAGTNGSVTMAGQYILAKEYLDNHPDATDVFLILEPEALPRTFDTSSAYQYAVMPFVESGTLDDLDPDTIKIIESVYGRPFLNPTVVDLIDRSPLNRKIYLNILQDTGDGYELKNQMELADRYICKINDLCVSKGVTFHLMASPVSEILKDYVAELSAEYNASKVYEINPHFLDDIYYYPAEQSADGRHFSGDYANQAHFNSLIEQVYGDTELMKSLRLE